MNPSLRRAVSGLALSGVLATGAISLSQTAYAAPGPGCGPVTTSDEETARRVTGDLTGKLAGKVTGSQVSCARAITAAVLDRGLTQDAAVIAVTAAITESQLRNIPGDNDHDAAGLFQQGESWGPLDRRLDPAQSAGAFLDAMEKAYPGGSWGGVPAGEVSQRVQAADVPRGYEAEAGDARRIIAALTATAAPVPTAAPSTPATSVPVPTAPAAPALAAPASSGSAQGASADGWGIARSTVISRAQYWFANRGRIYYNQGGRYPDPQGNTYRTDCSGYVSMALGLPRSYGTDDFAGSGSFFPISRSSLAPGDILNNTSGPYSSHHVILFDRWEADGVHFSYYSFGSTPVTYVRHASFSGTLDSHPAGNYRAFRYAGIAEDAVAAPPAPKPLMTGVGDIFGDGRQSFVSISGGTGTLYYGNGYGSFASSISLGGGWTGTQQIAGVGAFDGQPGHHGMLALRTDGSIWLYNIINNGGSATFAGPPALVDRGFNGTVALAGVGDVFGNGRQSFAVVLSNGWAKLFYGNGSGSWATSISLGGGWNGTSAISGVGDFAGRGGRGLLAQRTDGSTWLYNVINSSGYATLAGPASLVDRGFKGAGAIAGVGNFDGGHGTDFLYSHDGEQSLYLVSGNATGSWRYVYRITGGWR
ncbi:hypothetical protein [Longispora albida]|uniref:hypothetical protein n=1 Tax=Longispora albida TaxID=203523 RepID=UPI00037D8A33|nr:hypothetical protein [Longispora albida]